MALFTLVFWLVVNRTPSDSVVESTQETQREIIETFGDDSAPESFEFDIDQRDHFVHYIKSLPTAEDLQNLTPEEVHHTPEIIKEGGELVGRIYDEAENDLTKRADAMNFFKKCAEDEYIVTAIRAVCLNRVYKLMPEWKIPVPLSDSIPEDVVELSLKFP